MEKKNLDLKENFAEKQKLLDNAKKVLKQEFIGIDEVIDQVIDNVSGWFFLPGLQENPAVINLWGLTGVGKTSLVNRLVELIDFEDAYYRFDLGEKEGRFSLRYSLEDLNDINENQPLIIAFDEIQHSKTVEGPLRENVDNDQNRVIWEIVDSGKIQYIDWGSCVWSLERTKYKLEHLIRAGVRAKNGIVVDKVELYCKEMDIPYEIVIEEDIKDVGFFPPKLYKDIIDLAGAEMGLYLEKDVREALRLSDNEIINFLDKVIKIGKKPSVKNFSKALIFVLGNLDEAYIMSSDFNADIDADEFNKLSKKITVPKIKNTLKNYFRNEQIARLGNIHIIYPALDKSAYKKVIENELEKYSKSLIKTFNINISFDKSVHDLIYKEGVYPAQGVRPIFTSIHQIIKSKISFFYSAIFLKKLDVDSLIFSIKGQKLICDYFKNYQKVYSIDNKVVTALEDIRKSKKNDMQAIVAVHESGHVVLLSVLLNIIPDAVYSITSGNETRGFVSVNFPWEYISRKELIPRVAVMLGGYVSEELIFGEEHLTSGATGDIEKATEFLSDMYKENGMGETPIKYSIPMIEDNNSYHRYDSIEEKIKSVIEEAKLLAEKSLKKEKKLLLSLSDYLSDNRMLNKDEIKVFVEKQASSPVKIVNDGNYMYYREQLKKQVKNYEVSKISEFDTGNLITLNKDSQNM